MDLWNPYRIAIQALAPDARIIADKYHVLRLANEVVETVRKALRSSLSPSQAKQLKQDRKILLKLTWQQHIPDELAEAFQPLQQTVEVWKSEIFNFFETEMPLTNAYTERANLSIREATRITYGLSFRVLRAKLLFSPANTVKLKVTPQRFQPQAAPLL